LYGKKRLFGQVENKEFTIFIGNYGFGVTFVKNKGFIDE
jgi:hypothetical protein